MRCRDDRLPVDRPRQQIAGIGAPALRATVLFEFLARAKLALLHVGAAGEGAAVAADDRDLRLPIEVETAQRDCQMPHQIFAEGVELFRPVEGQRRNLITAGIFDQARCTCLRHLGSLPAVLLERAHCMVCSSSGHPRSEASPATMSSNIAWCGSSTNWSDRSIGQAKGTDFFEERLDLSAVCGATRTRYPELLEGVVPILRVLRAELACGGRGFAAASGQ